MPTKSRSRDLDAISESTTVPDSSLAGLSGSALLTKRETLDLKPKLDGIPMKLVTHDPKGNTTLVTVMPEDVVKCPLCMRNQPKANLPFHHAYHHR